MLARCWPSSSQGTGWVGWVQGSGAEPRIEVVDGRLELALSRRCSFAWVSTLARLPPAELFPEGAALVFDYEARGLELADVSGVRLEGLRDQVLSTASGPGVARGCVWLQESAWLSRLELELGAFGTCAVGVDVAVSIDNVRLEADPSCALGGASSPLVRERR